MSPEFTAGVSIAALVCALACAGLAGFALQRVLTLPQVPQLQAVVLELIQTTETLQSGQNNIRRDFRGLEEDVEHHLEQASTRMNRAKARESSEKREGRRAVAAAEAASLPSAPQLVPQPLSIDEQFALAEQEQWNQSGGNS